LGPPAKGPDAGRCLEKGMTQNSDVFHQMI